MSKVILRCDSCGSDKTDVSRNGFPICSNCKSGRFTATIMPESRFFELTKAKCIK